VPVPPTAVATAGSSTLVYELHLVSSSKQNSALDRLRISTGNCATALAQYDAVALSHRLVPLDEHPIRQEDAPASIAPSGRAAIFLELALAPGAAPRQLCHELWLRTGSASARVTAMVEVAQIPPVVIGPPLRGGPWVAVHHPDWPRGHRRVFYSDGTAQRLPGRYAIDWVAVDDKGSVSRGAADNPRDSLGYGDDVLAVSNATVAAVRDGIAESDSISGNSRHARADAPGNFIVLELAPRRYAFYEHLVPGSIRVQRGQQVKRGDVIGKLGFTGDSTGPHLHFHVADDVKPLDSEGMPFLIDSATLLGRYDDLSNLGKERWQESADGPTRRSHEWPDYNVVVDFSRR
jgi:murein DD-endopeptidase MepM/ murein hydrolase activator NlpD